MDEDDIPCSDSEQPVVLPKDRERKFLNAIKNAPPKVPQIQKPMEESEKSETKQDTMLLRSSEKDLLRKLQSLKEEGFIKDACGDCVSEIVAILQEKLEGLIETKEILKEENRNVQNSLCELNEESGKVKTKLYASEKELAKAKNINKKETEEILKFEQKVVETLKQIEEINTNSKKYEDNEQRKLNHSLKAQEKVLSTTKQRMDQERAEIEAVIYKEKLLVDELEALNLEQKTLKEKMSVYKEKEQVRQQSFKHALHTLGNTKG